MPTINSFPPSFQTDLVLPGGSTVQIPAFPSAGEAITINQWFQAIMVPSGTAGNIDTVNGTSSGWSSIVTDKSGGGFGGAKFFILGGRLKPGVTGPLNDNTIIVKINSVEVGRIYVSATSQTVGWTAFKVPGDAEDSRFNLTGVSTTGDFIFELTGADPDLELHMFLGGQD